MARLFVTGAAVLVMAATSSTSRQRDATRSAAASAVVRGIVVTADTLAPITDVTISLRSADQPLAPRPAAGLLASPPVTRPAPDGRFELQGIAAGRYRLAIDPGPTAARYLPVRFPDPAAEDGAALVVPSNQVLDGLVIALPRAAVITGRVVDERGNPMAHVFVNVREWLPGGRQRLIGAGRGPLMRTDDTGSFRIFGLKPGEYILAAQAPRVGSLWIEPAITVTAGTMPPVYYPGTASLAEAMPIRVGPGEEHGPIDFVLQPVRLFTVRGQLLDPGGQPVPGVNVSLRTPGSSMIGSTNPPVTSRTTRADGTFELSGVPAGDHEISAARYGPGGSQHAWQTARVAEDVEGLLLHLQPGVTVKGRVTFEGQAPQPLPTMYVRSRSGFAGGSGVAAGVMPGPDSSFTLDNQFGPTLIRVDAPPGWHLKAVLLGSQDIIDSPLEFATDGPPVQVVLTQHAGSLNGVVTTAGGVPAESSVVLFSEDPTLWHDRASTTKLVATLDDGKYRLEGLRPGRYLIAATSREESVIPAVTTRYFELLASQATEVTLAEGESKVVNLRRRTLR